MALEKAFISNKNKMNPKHIAYHQPYEYGKYEVTTAEQGTVFYKNRLRRVY
ncbi:hypothetical protein Ana3638_01280 [Anaerocolumna sedimenticola]|uniref:Uncharacterized protein n=1 Tax=Anaerocolumna sedimenticola TaxID=2696063 RepID=A0A6P1THN7_9FIRM|nr:hypothetical protein [Anaerocolumna sedimenticola]QHQ59599.1 hypothetical protein Ana3638_01280 [Anaerocolumna sedimenticola]